MKTPNTITRIFYLIFSVGFILFLGSLFSFIVLNIISEEPTVVSTYWQRLFVEKMTKTITIPGLALIVIGVFLFLKKEHPFSKRWMIIVQVLLALLIINTSVFVVPIVNTVNDLALEQLNSNVFLEEYTKLKMKEDMFGAVNILMTTGLLLIIIFRSRYEKI